MENKFSRRNFIGTFSKAGLAPIVAPGLLLGDRKDETLKKLSGQDDFVFLTPPYLQHPAEDSITIMWIVNKENFSWVEYGLHKDQLDHKAVNVHNGLKDAGNLINKIPLESLSPSTEYYYRICSREIIDFQPYKIIWGTEIKSDIYSFKTWKKDSGKVSWAVFNDIHDRPESFPLLYNLVNESENDFIFLNGDMVNFFTGQQQIIDHIVQPLASLTASRLPFIYGRGNHETRGKFARQQPLYFDNPSPGNGYYYSFTLGPVHFVILDSGEDKEDDHKEYSGLVSFDAYRKKQARWLAQEIETEAFKNAPFRVVMMHIPPYETGDWHGTLHCRKLFDPLFNKGKIDLLIAAHRHRYGTYPADPETHNYPIIIGGGPKDGIRTIITAKAVKEKLEVRIVRDDGQEAGNVKLSSRVKVID